ncbi:MAG TPA: NAD(P)H-binding protein, partial [Thermomicrobiales bacterium]|nr:NAD(P)H-binding protein [Thermomicrobiales bacterium]
GGTGKTGRRVAERLAALDMPVRIGSRSGAPSFDWEYEAGWGRALDNVGAVYLTYYPDLAVPGAAETIGAFVDLARQRGVQRLVLLSGRGEEEAERAEEVVKASGIEWTIVRSSWFAQNFSESYLRDPILDGEVVLPVGNVGEPFIDADDIADVAVAALTEDGHASHLYEVTGPRLLTFAEAVAEIAAVSGRDIRYVQVTPEEYKAAMEEMDVPADVVRLITYLFTTVLDGRNAHVSDGVQRALGRPPRDFGDYALAAAATGAWEVQEVLSTR